MITAQNRKNKYFYKYFYTISYGKVQSMPTTAQRTGYKVEAGEQREAQDSRETARVNGRR